MHVIEMVSEALDGGRLGGRIIWRGKMVGWFIGQQKKKTDGLLDGRNKTSGLMDGKHRTGGWLAEI